MVNKLSRVSKFKVLLVALIVLLWALVITTIIHGNSNNEVSEAIKSSSTNSFGSQMNTPEYDKHTRVQIQSTYVIIDDILKLIDPEVDSSNVSSTNSYALENIMTKYNSHTSKYKLKIIGRVPDDRIDVNRSILKSIDNTHEAFKYLKDGLKYEDKGIVRKGLDKLEESAKSLEDSLNVMDIDKNKVNQLTDNY